MPYPIQTQTFTVFMGTQEGIHSVALPAIYSSSGSRNLWIDKLGRAKKILGYSKQNSSAVTTNTGGAATLVRALRGYRQTGAAISNRQIIGVLKRMMAIAQMSMNSGTPPMMELPGRSLLGEI